MNTIFYIYLINYKRFDSLGNEMHVYFGTEGVLPLTCVPRPTEKSTIYNNNMLPMLPQSKKTAILD